MRKVTFVYPIIRTDFIKKSIETLYKYTNKEDFNLIVVDQSIEGLDKEFIDKYIHLYLRMKNQGFSKAANEGIIHALRWGVPFIAVVNDDTEFMYYGWLDDAIKEFDSDPKIVAVCPESPRIAGWGYGLEHGACIETIPYKEEFSAEDIAYLKQGDYQKERVVVDNGQELPASFPLTKRGVIDAIAMWLPIFKREAFIELGLFEERFIWGGGEDYDMNARAYSCAYPIPREECDPAHHRRMVSTMKSWVWHHWGRSKDIKEELDPKLFDGKEPWNNNNEIWSPGFDVWGHVNVGDIKKPIKRLVPPKIEVL